jgi:DNA-binding NarL/FixJ family response regulator
MKILIVEDSELKAKNIALCAKQCAEDAEIIQASNAHDGFNYVALGGIDLVFLDVLLPLKVGGEPSEDGSIWFVREVQRKVSDSNLPLIVGTTQYFESIAKVEEIFRDYLWSVVYVAETQERWRHQIAHAIRFAKTSAIRTGLSNADTGGSDVAIVTAVRVPEFEEVVNALGGGDPYFIHETNETWMCRKLTLPSGREVSIIGACADEMGMCAMAALVTRLCIACRPKKLVLAGIMGGNSLRVGMSDLVVVEETWNCRAGKITGKGFEADMKVQSASYKLINAARTIIKENDLMTLWKDWTAPKPRQIVCG